MAKILLVDDDHLFATMIQTALTRAGETVVRAKNGVEAMELFDASFDLVLTDLVMPEKEGMELIGELRRALPGVKIIAMSGGGRSLPGSYLRMAERLGAAVALHKPFSTDQLFRAVKAVLSADD